MKPRIESEGTLARTRAAAVTLAAFAASYSVLGAWYFYHDFFKFLGRSMPTAIDGSGLAVQVNCYVWTVLSPWRLLGLTIAVGLLGLSAFRLWRRRDGARALSLVTLWGVLLPQLLWFTEFVVDWRQGHGLLTTVLAGLALVLVPTMLLFEGKDTLSDWRSIASSRTRVLLTAIATAWIAFAATEFIDHSYQLDSDLAYGGALAATAFGVFGVWGLLRLKVWGLLAAVAAASSLMLLPWAFSWGQYLPTGGFIDGFVSATSGGCSARALASGLVPLALIGWLSAPLLRNALHRLRA